MKKEEIRYIVEDYCSCHEIEITTENINQAVEDIAERYADIEEYNYRCGVYSVDIDSILDSYFEEAAE